MVEAYEADGLFARWNIVWLRSHREGGLLTRLASGGSSLLRFVGLLMLGRVAVVHCHAAMKGSFWRKSIFALLARAAGVPVVFHLHGGVMKAFVARQPVVLQRLIALILEKQSVVLVLSQSWASYVKSIAPRATVTVLPNYVVVPDRVEYEQEGTSPRASVDVLYLGVINAAKGIYDLLQAFKIALEGSPDLRLIIGGKGEVEQAQAYARQLGIESRVVFAGWVTGQQKTALLRQAQIFVLPSYNEGLPISILEAMSWRLPIISTRVGGIPEVVREGQDGLLITPGDQQSLAIALMSLSQDFSLRQAMGESARRQIEKHYSKEVVLPVLDDIYRSLLDEINAQPQTQPFSPPIQSVTDKDSIK